ncbi:MAG: ABC transporter substrate-binding protein [Halobacteria archaeon]|nr:ABC transporter substrate-binding protein [Halobacteria archaeon]
MSDNSKDNNGVRRRTFLKGIGATGVTGLAGCLGGGGDGGTDGGTDGGDGGDGGTDGGDGGTDGGAGPITIGAIQPLSGNFAPWGQAHQAGLEFGVNEVNNNGGVLDGRQLQIVSSDTKSDPAEAATIFQRFVEQDNAVAITGPVSSDVGIRTAQSSEQLQVPLYLHMSGSAQVLTKDSRYTFRVGLLPAPTTMRAQAQLVEDQGFDKVGAIIADYAWGRSVEKSINQFFPDNVDVNIQVAPIGASDFSPFLSKMDQDIDMMVATGHPPGEITIMKQQFQQGLSPEVTTGAGLPPQVIFGALGETATQGFTHLHNTDVYTQEFADFASRFIQQTGKPVYTHEPYGYVTAKLIAAAIEDAGSADPTAIADATRNIKFDTLFAQPIQYTQWGELKNQVQIYSTFEAKAPSYYSEGDFRLTEVFRTDPLPAFDPEGF